MKKLLVVALAAGLFVGNAMAITVTLEKVKVNNNTNGDIWITWNAFTDSCAGQCNYKRIQAGKSLATQGSLYKKNLNVYAYEGTNGVGLVQKGYKAKSDRVDVSILKGKLNITEPATN